MNSPVTGEFTAQRSSNAENVSIWWRHHETIAFFPEPFLCWIALDNKKLYIRIRHFPTLI